MTKRQLTKYTLLALFIAHVSGCATIPPARTADENANALMPMVRAGDRGGIQKYFKDYSSCDNPDAVVGCYQRDKGLLIGSSRMTVEEFLSVVDKAHQSLNDGLANCGDDIECLSKIDAAGSVVCSSQAGHGCLLVTKLAGRQKSYHVENAEMVGDDLAVTDTDLKKLRDRFSAAAEKANQISANAQASHDKESSERAAVFTQLRNAHCTQLGGYQISQKISDHQYEIGTGDSVHGGQCLEQSGECTQAFKVEGEHAILETVKTEFNSQGYVPDRFYVKAIGSRASKMKNGFAQKLTVYRESVECGQIAAPLYTH